MSPINLKEETVSSLYLVMSYALTNSYQIDKITDDHVMHFKKIPDPTTLEEMKAKLKIVK